MNPKKKEKIFRSVKFVIIFPDILKLKLREMPSLSEYVSTNSGWGDHSFGARATSSTLILRTR